MKKLESFESAKVGMVLKFTYENDKRKGYEIGRVVRTSDTCIDVELIVSKLYFNNTSNGYFKTALPYLDVLDENEILAWMI